MAGAFPLTSSGAGVESYYIKEPKVDIPPHRKVVLPIRGPIIHDASEFMAAHLELNYVEVSHKYKYFTGIKAHLLQVLLAIVLLAHSTRNNIKSFHKQRVPVTCAPVTILVISYVEHL